MKCTGHTTAGNPCKLDAIRGGLVCHKHGGSAPHVKANAAVRAEVMAWGLGDAEIDPGVVLLRLVSQSAVRAERYALELEQLVADSPSLHAALVGEAQGEWGPLGEYARGLQVVEAQERDRCAGFAAKAIAAGLMERQVKLAERQGALLAGVLRSVLSDPTLGLSDDQRSAVPGLIRRHLSIAG